MFKETLFAQCRMKKGTAVGLLFLLNSGLTPGHIITLTGLNKETVARWGEYYADMLAWDLNNSPGILGGDGRIGGNGIIFEVDESKFGKRKHHRGHPVEGVWVIGGAERGGDRRVFLAQVPDCSAETLAAVIEQNVAPGTLVYSDCWKVIGRRIFWQSA
jgi:hypothetical protein